MHACALDNLCVLMYKSEWLVIVILEYYLILLTKLLKKTIVIHAQMIVTIAMHGLSYILVSVVTVSLEVYKVHTD